MRPPDGKRITDKTFRYKNAASTNIGKTFARIRWEQEQEKRAALQAPPPPLRSVK